MLIILWLGKRGGSSETWARRILIGILVASYPMNLAAWSLADAPQSLDNMLPFHLCDVATFLAAISLWKKNDLLAAMTYFWGLAATMQGLLTPALSLNFPHPAFFSFFIQHIAIVITALYLPIVAGWRPRRPLMKTVGKVWLYSIAYLACAMGINRLLGTNFAFASRPPDNPSLIDHLGPWPWYLAAMAAIALGIFSLLALPFLRKSPHG